MQATAGQGHAADAGGLRSIGNPADQPLDQRGMEVGGTASGVLLVDQLHQERVEVEHRHAVRPRRIDVVAARQRQAFAEAAGQGFEAHRGLAFEAHRVANAEQAGGGIEPAPEAGSGRAAGAAHEHR